MANLTIAAANVATAEVFEQVTLPAAEDIVAGQYVRLDTNGKFALGNATAAGEVGQGGAIALTSVKAGYPVTGLRKGYLNVGTAADAMAFGDPVYLSDTDGTLATGAGTVSTVVGRIYPVWGGAAGTADRLIRIDMA